MDTERVSRLGAQRRFPRGLDLGTAAIGLGCSDLTAAGDPLNGAIGAGGAR